MCVCIYIFLQINEKTSSISIQMSFITKKKYVVNEALQRYELPDEKHYIVKVKIKKRCNSNLFRDVFR
jgi:hypothetical protein